MEKNITPYGAAKIVNNELDKHSLKRIPPQMMYNYTTARINAKKKPFIEVDEKGLVKIDSLNDWLKKYIEKRIEKAKNEEEVLNNN